MSSWRPALSTDPGVPLYRRLVAALAADIEAGKLAAGARLPPQRDLAHTLSISVGAVTRAYDEAARRGLIAAHVGRGSFVADRSGRGTAAHGPIDLTVNVAPIAPAAAMAETLAALRRTTAWTERLDYQPAGGLDADRKAAAAWLGRTAGFGSIDWRNLILCAGAQGALAIACAALLRPGDAVLAEAATFSGAKALAAVQGYRLHGVAMDGEGLMPEALDRAAAATRARLVYALPTLQNPTARTMGRARRAEIVAVARARDLVIVEDDVYAPYAADRRLPPLAELAPERTLYVSSLSKILAPGLRSGFLVAPAGDTLARCLRATRALMHSPSGIAIAIATDWIESGRADALAADVRGEADARARLALGALQGLAEVPQALGLHLWLPLDAADAERAAARALSAGVRLAPPRAFAVADEATSGLRICLGCAPNRATLERALAIVKDALTGGPEDPLDAPL